MEERRKIIIPTGAEDPDATVSKPFFNTEATRAARPVVPLPETPQPQPAPAQPVPQARSKRWMIIAPIVLAAVSVGIAAGFAISSYQSGRTVAESSVAVRPVASKSSKSLPWTHTPEDEELAIEDDALASAEETIGATTGQPTQVAEDNPPRAEEANKDKERSREAARERAEDRRDRAQSPDAERVDEEDNNRADEDRERRRQEREQRRARRNRRNDDDLPEDPIRRTRDEVHRIREIFEGIP